MMKLKQVHTLSGGSVLVHPDTPTIIDYKGRPTLPPADLPTVLATSEDGHTIVWSAKPGEFHRVRYGLQVQDFTKYHEAGREFVRCVEHWIETEGMHVPA